MFNDLKSLCEHGAFLRNNTHFRATVSIKEKILDYIAAYSQMTILPLAHFLKVFYQHPVPNGTIKKSNL